MISIKLSKGEVFLIHGFTGNPGDLEKISNFLNKQGYDTIRVLLKRHKEDEEEKGHNTNKCHHYKFQ